MLFDFQRFSRIAASVYNQGSRYTLDECLTVFRCYFETYEEYIKRAHPPIRAPQIARIMKDMPFVMEGSKECGLSDIHPATYPYLIRLHFKTRYQRCDYNINHFFSGKIRELRLHETEAGDE